VWYRILEAITRVFVIFLDTRWRQRKLGLVSALSSAAAAIIVSIVIKAFQGAGFNWGVLVCFLFASCCASFCFCVIWVYSSELFPTPIRNAGVGASSMSARLASIGASQLLLLSSSASFNTPEWSAPACMALAAVVGAITVAFILPETGHRPLPTDIKAVRAARREDKRSGFKWYGLQRETRL